MNFNWVLVNHSELLSLYKEGLNLDSLDSWNGKNSLHYLQPIREELATEGVCNRNTVTIFDQTHPAK